MFVVETHGAFQFFVLGNESTVQYEIFTAAMSIETRSDSYTLGITGQTPPSKQQEHPSYVRNLRALPSAYTFDTQKGIHVFNATPPHFLYRSLDLLKEHLL